MTDYLSVKQYAAKHGIDGGRVRKLIAAGRIPATKVGNQWVIEAATPPPDDKRVKSGKYVGWRKPKSVARKERMT